MSKETKEQAIEKLNKKVWYQSALLPWLIIAFAFTLFVGVVTGWTMRSYDNSRIQAEASAMVKTLK